mgnify:CR=1
MFEIVLMGLFVLFVAFLSVFGQSFIKGAMIYLCWNFISPELTTLPDMTYLQAVAVALIFSTLFDFTATVNTNEKKLKD